MNEPVCLVCGHVGLDRHLDILLRCPVCAFVTADIDHPADAQELYGGDYFRGEEYLDYQADEAFFKKNFRVRLTEILRRRAGGRLLEIGAAYGFFLDVAKPHFEVVGFEVNPEAARHARAAFGVDVRTDDFLLSTSASIGGPVDVTVMWDVIEHLSRPDRFVAHVAELSRPGALLYVTTGDIGSPLARWRGRRWRMIHPPTHLHYFSRATLSRLLERYGFRVLDVRSIGVARSFRQVLYSILVLRMGRRGAYEALKNLIAPTWGFTLNMLDIMKVVAERTR
ncbi:MAG TPA: class I SAM-dependent methyltransferase [Candidatus Acidoferrales bacterium]|nr:class I SAM-dependent methyltransferase [Candidatus Acidoferrales bacterium]